MGTHTGLAKKKKKNQRDIVSNLLKPVAASMGVKRHQSAEFSQLGGCLLLTQSSPLYSQ